MSLAIEREVHISWTEEDNVATIYCSSPVTMAKLDKLCKDFPDVYRCVKENKGKGYHDKTYKCDMKNIGFKKPKAKIEYTEERKAKAREAMERINDSKRLQKSAD